MHFCNYFNQKEKFWNQSKIIVIIINVNFGSDFSDEYKSENLLKKREEKKNSNTNEENDCN